MMDIKTLKSKIKQNTLNTNPLILIYQDIPFVCDQYIDQICKNKNLEKLKITKLADITNDDELFDTEKTFLYVYETEKLDEIIPENLENIIVVTKAVSKNEQVETITIPKLANWQIEDYVKTRVSGISEAQAKWLCDVSKYNIYRLKKECDKLSIFSKEMQQLVFNQMNAENVYCDLNNLTIFNFITAIVNKDYDVMSEVLENLHYLDVEPTGFCSLLLKQYKTIIEAKFYTQWSSFLSSSEKQFYYLKNNISRNYSPENLVNIYEKITSIDYLLKSGQLSENYIIDYLLINILSLK